MILEALRNAGIKAYNLIRIRDGKQVPLQGHECVRIDYTVQTFIVQVRTLNGIGPQRLKDVIQTRYEVVGEPEIVNTTAIAL